MERRFGMRADTGRSLCRPEHPRRWRIPPGQPIPLDPGGRIPQDIIARYTVCNVCHPPIEECAKILARPEFAPQEVKA